MNIIAFGSGLMLVQTWFGSRCTWIYDLFEYLFIVRTVSGVWLRCEIYGLLFVAPLLACLSWCLGSIAIFFSVQPPVHPCEKGTGPEWWLGKSWRGGVALFLRMSPFQDNDLPLSTVTDWGAPWKQPHWLFLSCSSFGVFSFYYLNRRNLVHNMQETITAAFKYLHVHKFKKCFMLKSTRKQTTDDTVPGGDSVCALFLSQHGDHMHNMQRNASPHQQNKHQLLFQHGNTRVMQ